MASIQVGATVSVHVWRFGAKWASETFGKEDSKLVRAIGKVKKKLKGKACWKITFRNDQQDYNMEPMMITLEPDHADDHFEYLDQDLKKLIDTTPQKFEPLQVKVISQYFHE